jgi:cyclin-dependent kinase regulatory subunit CKS1
LTPLRCAAPLSRPTADARPLDPLLRTTDVRPSPLTHNAHPLSPSLSCTVGSAAVHSSITPKKYTTKTTDINVASRIEYSEKYNDIEYEYRHVILPKELARNIPKNTLLSDKEWRSIGVQQSRGWQHYAVHRPEPHILLFRRPLGTNPATGKVDPAMAAEAKARYRKEYMGNAVDAENAIANK